jgi:AcrR family transcriptional regulator
MTELAVSEGHLSASIARVIAHAGVSRPTFYEYFSDREDCFLAALAAVHERLLGEVERALAEAPPEHAMGAALAALVSFAGAEPALAQLLMNEPMAGGPQTLAARDEGIRAIAQLIDGVEQEASTAAATPDLPPHLLIGGVFRLLVARLRHQQPDMTGVLDDLLPWLSSYGQPRRRHRWRALVPLAPPASWPLLPEMLMQAPPPLSERRARRRENLRENQRQRIIFATAELAAEIGYSACSIAAITERAGVERRTFNVLFADKQQAFMAIHELAFQRTMALTAGAFFNGASWSDRIWEAGRAFIQFFHSNPVIARIGFIDSYAVGAEAIKRVEDSHTAFTIFLNEGHHEPGGSTAATSPLALEAIAAVIFEIGYHEARRESDPRLSSLLPHIAFVCLAPFLTPAKANRFIEGRLAQISP